MHPTVDALVWLRNDLRLHDNPAIARALELAPDSVGLVYCIDPRHVAPTELGLPKMGAWRAQFLKECLEDLRQQLQAMGADLILLRGLPEVEVPALAEQIGARHVVFQQEPTTEEQEVVDALERALDKSPVSLHSVWGATLYHIDDLPFDPADLPEVFTHFRKEVERHARVRPEHPTPESLNPLPQHITPGPMLQLEELGLELPPVDTRRVVGFEGGERAGLARLHEYFWKTDRLKVYKETRNGMLHANESSKFSPWLAHGALSPRRIAHEVSRYEEQRVKNKSTYWMIFELIWRDYFHFLAVAEGHRLFTLTGIQQRRMKWRRDERAFWRWARGETGVPFVDAHMRELNATGFMSNRGRQNVGSFLAKYLHVDWRWGASYFESVLIDYDPASNWGNWQYVSGVGNDPRDRRFNVVGQGERYDPKGAYIRRWVPELDALPNNLVHAPYDYNKRDLKQEYGVQLGVDYPEPVVPMDPRRG